MELSEQQEYWEDFTGAIGFKYQGYSLVEEVRSIFDLFEEKLEN